MTNKRILEDLEALEVIEISEEGGDGKAHVWSVTEAASALFSANPTRDNGGKGERGKYIGRGGESGWGSDDYIRPDGTIDFSRLLGGLA